MEGVERLQSESEFRLPVDVDGAADFRVDLHVDLHVDLCVDLRVDLRVAGPQNSLGWGCAAPPQRSRRFRWKSASPAQFHPCAGEAAAVHSTGPGCDAGLHMVRA